MKTTDQLYEELRAAIDNGNESRLATHPLTYPVHHTKPASSGLCRF